MPALQVPAAVGAALSLPNVSVRAAMNGYVGLAGVLFVLAMLLGVLLHGY